MISTTSDHRRATAASAAAHQHQHQHAGGGAGGGGGSHNPTHHVFYAYRRAMICNRPAWLWMLSFGVLACMIFVFTMYETAMTNYDITSLGDVLLRGSSSNGNTRHDADGDTSSENQKKFGIDPTDELIMDQELFVADRLDISSKARPNKGEEEVKDDEAIVPSDTTAITKLDTKTSNTVSQQHPTTTTIEEKKKKTTTTAKSGTKTTTTKTTTTLKKKSSITKKRQAFPIKEGVLRFKNKVPSGSNNKKNGVVGEEDTTMAYLHCGPEKTTGDEAASIYNVVLFHGLGPSHRVWNTTGIMPSLCRMGTIQVTALDWNVSYGYQVLRPTMKAMERQHLVSRLPIDVLVTPSASGKAITTWIQASAINNMNKKDDGTTKNTDPQDGDNNINDKKKKTTTKSDLDFIHQVSKYIKVWMPIACPAVRKVDTKQYEHVFQVMEETEEKMKMTKKSDRTTTIETPNSRKDAAKNRAHTNAHGPDFQIIAIHGDEDTFGKQSSDTLQRYAYAHVVELKGGHAVYKSSPEDFITQIMKALTKTTNTSNKQHQHHHYKYINSKDNNHNQHKLYNKEGPRKPPQQKQHPNQPSVVDQKQ